MRGRLFAVFACAMLSGGCSSGPRSDAPPPDIGRRLSSLTVDDRRWLCDWTNEQEGGYGAITDCNVSRATLLADHDQAMCLYEEGQLWRFAQPTCTMTVGDWMYCVQSLLATWCSTESPPPNARCDALATGCFIGELPDAGRE